MSPDLNDELKEKNRVFVIDDITFVNTIRTRQFYTTYNSQ